MIVNTIIKEDIRKCLIQSSNIRGSEYDLRSSNLLITFNNGSQYIYEKVSEADYIRFETSTSQGKTLNTHIKPNYTAHKVDEEIPLDKELFNNPTNTEENE